MSESELPEGLRCWLDHERYTVLNAQQIVGGFAAAIYHLTVQTGSKPPLDLIYKKFAPGRAQEYDLYQNILVHLHSYAPHALGFVKQPDEQGIVLEHAGPSLKTVLRGLGSNQGLELLCSAATWLAELHVQCEELGREWGHTGHMGPYPIESSLEWGNDAIEALTWLAEQHLFDVDTSTVVELQTMIDWFYPRFGQWMTGRMTITHGDPHTENLMYKGGRWRLIDWEYTCVAPPQRDLAIFLQDVTEKAQHEAVRTAYVVYLRQHGWNVDEVGFHTTYNACVFDNTLMMLGWEVYKFRQGHLTRSELGVLVTSKLNWLRDSFGRLYTAV